ncbi:hypothetical protein WKH56_05965 [Priestia sp. SB1]|uniref:hypothetical protein n=1 Tax=Priestia sp. SB1 TaxID=3132359 RepID=UPI003176FC3D
MEKELNRTLKQIEEELYKYQDYKLLFPNFSNCVLSWIQVNAPHFKKRNPGLAIKLALKRIEHPLNLTRTNRLTNIMGKDFPDKLQYWSKLGVTLNATYTFNTDCICEMKHYSFNDRLGFAQWKKHIKDDDLQLRLTFGEPLIDVFKEWRERRVKDIEDRYNEELAEFAKSLQNELDRNLIKVLNEITA